jgi:hypothetical protein
MSKNERYQLSLLGVIAGIADKNYFGRLSGQFLALASNGMEAYHKLSSDKEYAREMPKIIAFFDYVDSEIAKKNWNSSMIFLLSFVSGISTDLLQYLKDEKKRSVWEALNELASEETSKNYDQFHGEIDKADEMIEFVSNYDWNK